MDLKAGGGLRGVELAATMRRSAGRVTERMITTPLPVVTAVHGVCAGLGLTLALAADHCVATPDARFFAAFVKRSLVPDGATTYLLPRLVGLALARRMLLFGEEITASDGAAAGLISEIADAETLLDVAQRRAEALASLPTQTIAYTKGMLSRSFDVDLATVLFEERHGQALLSTTADYAEGIAAFNEKRQAHFEGR
jgi:2-(1,2-epoxy-1,2-dihydrophenyl)acetyl-CoA isomerase